MKASIEQIKKNKDGACIMTVLSMDPDAEILRLGDIEMTQRKYEQMKFESEQ